MKWQRYPSYRSAKLNEARSLEITSWGTSGFAKKSLDAVSRFAESIPVVAGLWMIGAGER
jgi:hypothetical protein